MPPSEPAWRVGLNWLALAAGLALVLAGAAAGAARVDIAAVLPLTLGFLPATLVAVVGGAMVGRMVAQGLLRAGGESGFVASLLAVVAGVSVVVAVVGVAAWGPARRPAVLAAAAVGLALGVAVMAIARAGLRRALAYRLAPKPTNRTPWLTFVLAALAGGGLALVGSARSEVTPAAAAAAFPPPTGRVAVLAVDGLAREDLEAAVALGGPPGITAIASWGWAPLRVGDAHLPAVLWTTVACGVGPERHGVEELEEVRLFGSDLGTPLGPLARAAVLTPWGSLGLGRAVARPALVRRAATFWEMAARAGCPVLVGGWWGSWPVRRVLGEIVSERAWLGGAVSPDAVTPALAPLVRAAWEQGGGAVPASERLALALVNRGRAGTGPRVLALSLPGIDLVERAHPGLSPVATACLVLERLGAVADVVESARQAGFSILLVGVPWHGGHAFVASSAAASGRLPEIEPRDLASTCLDALGLPPALGTPAPRRDLSGASGPGRDAISYGPPPPPVADPAPAALAVQREVLRSLGYLQ
ncbi:MAG: hypothetical protein ACM3O7_00950 [Acidobacteriota bacterium]